MTAVIAAPTRHSPIGVAQVDRPFFLVLRDEHVNLQLMLAFIADPDAGAAIESAD